VIIPFRTSVTASGEVSIGTRQAMMMDLLLVNSTIYNTAQNTISKAQKKWSARET
jgi:hypothetical protein